MKRQALALTGCCDKGKRTRREGFLAAMERVVPCSCRCGLIVPHFPKGSPAGRRPPLERVRRIHCLQPWYSLSDPAAEEARYDSLTMRQFAGARTDADVIADETSILNSRRLLEPLQLSAPQRAAINTDLAVRQMIVDATIINAPYATENAKQKRDPAMHLARKGKQWGLGMKVHTGTDSGLVHTVCATGANVAHVIVAERLPRGGKASLHGYLADCSEEPKAQAKASGVKFDVNERGTRTRPLTKSQRERNRAPVAGTRHGRACVPDGRTLAGSGQGARPGVREESRPDAHAVRTGQSVAAATPLDAGVGQVRPRSAERTGSARRRQTNRTGPIQSRIEGSECRSERTTRLITQNLRV